MSRQEHIKKIDKNLENASKTGKEIRRLQQELFEEKKKELPQILEKQLKDITEHISEMSVISFKNGKPEKRISPTEVYKWLKSPMVSCRVKYTAEELEAILDTYAQIISEINKEGAFIPTKINFSSFCGISSLTYDRWLTDVDHPERAEVMKKIDDYITDMQQSLAQMGEVKEISTIFRMKSEHGRVEATAPQEIRVAHELNASQIKEQLDAVRQGKSLRTIEMDEKDGIWKQKEKR